MPLPAGYLQHGTSSMRGRKFALSAIRRQTWTNPATIDTDGFVTAVTMLAAAGTAFFTLDGALVSAGIGVNDYARNVVITVTHASAVIAANGVITGEDMYGNVITEAWSVTAGGTSKTYTGAKAFKKVTSISQTVAADASTNTFIAGNGKVLGLDMLLSMPSFIEELEDGAAPTAGVVVVGVPGSAVADALGTYTPNSTLNGALDFDLWYVTDDPWRNVDG